MTRASTGMLEKGTQTPSPSPDLIPARNRPRDGSLKAEIVSMEGCNENNSKCANRRLSQPRGSPQWTVPKLCPNHQLTFAVSELMWASLACGSACFTLSH